MTDYHPPTGPEIAEHLEAGGAVEWWSSGAQAWYPTENPAPWRDRAAIQPGYRLVPLPPKTERVMAWEAVRDGRMVATGIGPKRVRSVEMRSVEGPDHFAGFAQKVHACLVDGWCIPIADDGTIEVLVEGPE